MMASIVGSVLESALEALACDPTVFVAALVPQPDIPARQAGRRNAMPASVEAGVGDEEARRALAEAEGRVVDLEAEMFAEYLLESAIFRCGLCRDWKGLSIARGSRGVALCTTLLCHMRLNDMFMTHPYTTSICMSLSWPPQCAARVRGPRSAEGRCARHIHV